MIINQKLIATLNPCSDRFVNFVKQYGDKNFTPRQFMGLKRITHEDKMWVALRLMSKESARLAATDFAESVLHLFESKFPNDNRPRKAIEVARTGGAASDARAAASDAANYARGAAYAANAAYNAAYYAANAAYYAAYAAAYYAAAYYARGAAYDQKTQEKLNRTICLRYLK